MAEQIPPIIITYFSDFPNGVIDFEVYNISDKKLRILAKEQQNGPYWIADWMHPTSFSLYVLKTYFDIFPSEKKKDHFQKLKESCFRLLDEAKGIKSNKALSTLPYRLSPHYAQSLGASIIIEIKTGCRIKLLFDKTLDLEDWNDALEEFFGYISEHYDNFPEDKLSKIISELEPKPGKEIYAVINPETKIIGFFDGKALQACES